MKLRRSLYRSARLLGDAQTAGVVRPARKSTSGWYLLAIARSSRMHERLAIRAGDSSRCCPSD